VFEMNRIAQVLGLPQFAGDDDMPRPPRNHDR
jgi:hypothetical protein